MQESKYKKAGEHSFLSPLFVDTEFVPNKLRYFTLFNRKVSNIPTVLPYENDSISLKDLEEQVSSICSPRDNNTSISLQSSLNLTKHDSIKGLKYRSCKKKIDGEEIEASEDGSVDFDKISNRNSESQSCERFDLCLIMMNKVDQVIHLSFRWKSEEQAKQEILSEVNRTYNADLKPGDLCLNSLTFQCRKGQAGETTLKFNPKPIKSIKDHIFQTDKLAYIGIEIITNKFSISKAKSPEKYVVSAINPANESFIEFSLPNSIAYKMNFEKVKQFQVREILGILGVENPESRGLMVMNQIFEPTALIYMIGCFFKENALINYLSASVAEESEVLFEEINKSPSLNEAELRKIAEEDYRFKDASFRRNSMRKATISPLSLFNSDCQIHNNKESSFNFMYHIIHKSIRNFFTHYNNFFGSSISNRFIQSMLEQMYELPIFKGEAYRKLGYELDFKKGDALEFNNFIVASRDKDFLNIKLPRVSQSRTTQVKIISESGRIVGPNSQFQSLSQVIFVPFTMFEVTKRQENQANISLTLTEIKPPMNKTASSVILWLDNKSNEKQGKGIYSHLRMLQTSIFLYQFAETDELHDWINTHKRYKDACNIRIIVITNMKRNQKGSMNNNAGIQAINLTRIMLSKATIIVFIGNIEYTNKNLQTNKINPKTLRVTNSTNQLLDILKNECLQCKASLKLMANIFDKIGKQDYHDYMSFIKENQSENPFQLVKKPQNEVIAYKSPPKQQPMKKVIGQQIKDKAMVESIVPKQEVVHKPVKQEKYQPIKNVKKNEVVKSKVYEPPKPMVEQKSPKHKSTIFESANELDIIDQGNHINLPKINQPFVSGGLFKASQKNEGKPEKN